MGDVIELAQRRKAREDRLARATAPRVPARVEFAFDLGCPFSYLAAERVDRSFGPVTWVPASAPAMSRASWAGDPDVAEVVRLAAERRAGELRLPLVWPERFPTEVPAAMRAAHFAAEQGRGAAFALAAGRLAFCGGFDLDDPEILAEAAAAAGIGLEETLAAAGDRGRDGAIEQAARGLLAAGADRLPVLRVAGRLYWGERRVGEAAAAARLVPAAVR